MRAPVKPCTLGAKHHWTWKRDHTEVTHPTPGAFRLVARGVYRCACGAAKYGPPQAGLFA